jgi:predicted nucleic acid-binding protein
MNIAVADASPLIALAKIDRFSLLKWLFREIVVPEAVWEEVVMRGVDKPAAELAISAEREGWLHRQPVKDPLAVMILLATLGPGEAEAIALAQEVRATWVLLDDDLARAHADRLGLKTKGAAGILLAAYKAGFLDDLKAGLDELRAQGFWLSDRIYNAILAAAGV